MSEIIWNENINNSHPKENVKNGLLEEYTVKNR